MSRVVQPSIIKRVAFATWARRNNIAKKSSVTYTVPDGVEVPEGLMVGAQVDGKLIEESSPKKPKRTRVRKTKDRGVVEEPGPPLTPEQEETTEETLAARETEQAAEAEHVFNPVDYPQHQDDPEASKEE